MRNIKGVREEYKRSALKTISWRIVGASTTAFLVYFFTGQLELTALVGTGDFVLKMVLYFLHERAWNTVAFGRSLHVRKMAAIKSSPPIASPSDNVSDIVQKIVATDIGAVVVVENDKPCGLITERDILERVLNAGKDYTKTCAKEIMSSPAITVDYNEDLGDMLKKMRDRNIRRLVVTRNGKVMGIVTDRGILEALA